jgi:hypothetical protein
MALLRWSGEFGRLLQSSIILSPGYLALNQSPQNPDLAEKEIESSQALI